MNRLGSTEGTKLSMTHCDLLAGGVRVKNDLGRNGHRHIMLAVKTLEAVS